MPPYKFRRIRHIDATVADGPWDYAERHRAAIDSRWAEWTAGNPHLFNGRVLVLSDGVVEHDVFRARYRPVFFAEFLHFMRLGTPDGHTKNGFALAGLASADGALAMGVMGSRTANAGKIYFPGGTPDLDDIVDGKVDLARSVRRELAEETGLGPADVSFDEGFWLYEDNKRFAFTQIARSPLSGAALRESILANLAAQPVPELADIHLVSTAADLVPDRMPPFQLAFAEWWLAGQPG